MNAWLSLVTGAPVAAPAVLSQGEMNEVQAYVVAGVVSVVFLLALLFIGVGFLAFGSAESSGDDD